MKTSNILAPALPTNLLNLSAMGTLQMSGLSGSLVTMEIVLATVLGNRTEIKVSKSFSLLPLSIINTISVALPKYTQHWERKLKWDRVLGCKL